MKKYLVTITQQTEIELTDADVGPGETVESVARDSVDADAFDEIEITVTEIDVNDGEDI